MNRIFLIKNQLNGSKNNELISVENALNDPSIKIVKMVTSLNTLTKLLLTKLYETLVNIDCDEETKIIILTGNGKSFAAGADIKKLSKNNYQFMAKNDWDLLPIENIASYINKPIIAAINGIAYGGGFELAMACDIILASDKARFGFPEIKIGLMPGAGGTQRLTKLLGYHKAMEYILTGKDIPLNILQSSGVINEIYENEKLLESSINFAKSISKFSLMGLIASKKAIKIALETGLSAGIKAEKFIFQGLFNTEDKQIGIDAFLNKKQPIFKDK